MKVAIIGLGLMGGSLALALKKSGFASSICGFDANDTHLQKALQLGLIDEQIDVKNAMSQDVLILAVPVDACINILQTNDTPSKHTTIIDLGSTKEKISNCLSGEARGALVAAHPMTGTEYSGPEAAVEGLYDGKTVVLCDIEKSGEYQAKIAKELFGALGMNIIEMDAKTHDMHAAYISHLPHIISYSLANTVLSRENPEDILSMAAGGFRDMSRLAKSRTDLWTQIFRQNKANLLESIELFEKNVKELKELIKSDDWDELNAALERAKGLHSIFK
jgi:prephenate dehydrogenase